VRKKKGIKNLHITSFVSEFSSCIDISGLQYLKPKGKCAATICHQPYGSFFSACKFMA